MLYPHKGYPIFGYANIKVLLDSDTRIFSRAHAKQHLGISTAYDLDPAGCASKCHVGTVVSNMLWHKIGTAPFYSPLASISLSGVPVFLSFQHVSPFEFPPRMIPAAALGLENS